VAEQAQRPDRYIAWSEWLFAGYRWVPPAGFEPALTAPEAAAVCVSELGKRALEKPLRGVTGAGSQDGTMPGLV